VADTRKETPPAVPPARDSMDNSRTKTPPAESALGRWSRMKAQARERSGEKPPAAPGLTGPQAPPPDLPAPEQLTFDSDYRQFFHPKVGEDVRRVALKKLFSDPRFNVMDGLDVYIDDYSKTEPIPAAMLAGLRQAQNIFQWAKEDAEARARAELAVEEPSQPANPEQAALEHSPPGPVPETRASESARASDGVSDAATPS
jgi:Protein of unknown function (DUF3306)